MSKSSKTDKQTLLKTIIEESRHRPVVPFVGSGISVSAGYPTIRLVIHYLAKVDFAIRFGVYRDRFPLVKGDKKEQKKLVEHYRKHPSNYLKDFGWPNIGQLDADLWNWLENKERKNKSKLNVHDLTEGYFRVWFDSLEQHLKQRYPTLFELINNLFEIIENPIPINENNDIFQQIKKLKNNSQTEIKLLIPLLIDKVLMDKDYLLEK